MNDDSTTTKHKIIPYEQQIHNPIDRNDPIRAKTAIEIRFPDTFSQKAKKGLKYFGDGIALFVYKGKFVATDESLYLTLHGDGIKDPTGCPRWDGDSLDELEQWLELVADDVDEEEKENSEKEQQPHAMVELKDAIRVVQAAIGDKEAKYRKIASTEDQEPVLVYGETEAGYPVHMMADPQCLAQACLDYEYAMWSTLKEGLPRAMSDHLAEIYGLECVNDVDFE